MSDIPILTESWQQAAFPVAAATPGRINVPAGAVAGDRLWAVILVNNNRGFTGTNGHFNTAGFVHVSGAAIGGSWTLGSEPLLYCYMGYKDLVDPVPSYFDSDAVASPYTLLASMSFLAQDFESENKSSSVIAPWSTDVEPYTGWLTGGFTSYSPGSEGAPVVGDGQQVHIFVALAGWKDGTPDTELPTDTTLTNAYSGLAEGGGGVPGSGAAPVDSTVQESFYEVGTWVTGLYDINTAVRMELFTTLPTGKTEWGYEAAPYVPPISGYNYLQYDIDVAGTGLGGATIAWGLHEYNWGFWNMYPPAVPPPSPMAQPRRKTSRKAYVKDLPYQITSGMFDRELR